MSPEREIQVREELRLSISSLESVSGTLEALKDDLFWGRHFRTLESAICGVKSAISEAGELVSTLEAWIEEDRVEEEEERLRAKREELREGRK